MATSPAILNKLQLDAGLCHVCHGQPVAQCSKTLPWPMDFPAAAVYSHCLLGIKLARENIRLESILI